jgi:hypothetical protein
MSESAPTAVEVAKWMMSQILESSAKNSYMTIRMETQQFKKTSLTSLEKFLETMLFGHAVSGIGASVSRLM